MCMYVLKNEILKSVTQLVSAQQLPDAKFLETQESHATECRQNGTYNRTRLSFCPCPCPCPSLAQEEASFP